MHSQFVRVHKYKLQHCEPLAAADSGFSRSTVALQKSQVLLRQFVDGRGHTPPAQTNFSTCTQLKKQEQTWPNLPVNIQHTLWNKISRVPKRYKLTSSCPLKHAANGQVQATVSEICSCRSVSPLPCPLLPPSRCESGSIKTRRGPLLPDLWNKGSEPCGPFPTRGPSEDNQ